MIWRLARAQVAPSLSDELSLFERLVAHAAGMLLRSQQAAELLLDKPIARDSVLSVGLLSGLR